MKSRIGWILAIVLGLLLVVVLVFSGFALGGGRNWEHGYGYGGMMRGPGMMEGYRFMQPYGHPFGGASILFGCLISLGILALVILGIIALVRNLTKPANPAPTQQVPPQEAPAQVEPGPTCSNCGKPIQSDWSNCPYCGNK